MIRLIATFAWLRWRVLLNRLKGGRRRDVPETLSRIAGVVLPAFVVLLSLGTAVLLGLLAFMSGGRVGAGTLDADAVLLVARSLLLLITLLLLVVPLAGWSHGEGSRQERLLLLPVRRPVLHAVEVLAGLGDPWYAFALPALFLFPAGLARSGRWTSALLALVAGIGMTAVLATLGSLVSFLLGWLGRNRRRSEVFLLAFFLLISLAGFVPVFLSGGLEQRARQLGAEVGSEPPATLDDFDRSLPAWSRALPSELYGRSLGDDLAGRHAAAWAGAAALLVEAAALYALSSAAHRRLLESAGTGRARRTSGAVRVGRRLPWLSAEASAVAAVQLRTALRSVRGRLAVLLPGPMLALLGLLSRRLTAGLPAGDLLGVHGDALLGAGILFSLLALQPFSLNQFASDGEGLALTLLAPVSDADLVRGKAVGCGMVLGVSVAICLAGALLVAPGGSPLAWIGVLLSGAGTALLIAPFAALLSALFPVRADLSKTGPGGNPHGLALLAGTLMTAGASFPPALVLAIGYHLFGRPALTLALLAAWSVLCASIGLPLLLGTATRRLGPRRENLLLVAQGK